MPEIRIHLDPCNPGQFYAYCGLLEVLELRKASTLSYYAIDALLPHKAAFVIESEAAIDILGAITRVAEAECEAIFRDGADGKQGPSRSRRGAAKSKDSTAPLLIHLPGQEKIILDWWLDEFWSDDNSNLKLWAGNQSSLQIWTKLCELLPRKADTATIFDSAEMAMGRFGVDPRSAWEALDLGYSPNKQNHAVRTYPTVEILAAIGLQGFRPKGTRRTGLGYCLWLAPLPTIVARSGCVQAWGGLPSMSYAYRLEGRGRYKYFSFAERATSAQE